MLSIGILEAEIALGVLYIKRGTPRGRYLGFLSTSCQPSPPRPWVGPPSTFNTTQAPPHVPQTPPPFWNVAWCWPRNIPQASTLSTLCGETILANSSQSFCAHFYRVLRTRWIGANPEKSNLVVISGVRTEENLVNSVFCCFSLGKTHKMLPKSRFSTPIFGDSAGSTKLDRPYCKRFWSTFSPISADLSQTKADLGTSSANDTMLAKETQNSLTRLRLENLAVQ